MIQPYPLINFLFSKSHQFCLLINLICYETFYAVTQTDIVDFTCYLFSSLFTQTKSRFFARYKANKTARFDKLNRRLACVI